MKLKLDANGNVVTQEVNGIKMPVYVRDDGTEAPFDAAATVASIASRAQQAQRVETENKDLKLAVAKFAGIDDPEAAKKALGIVANLDAKKLVDAGEIDRVRTEISKSYDVKINDLTKQVSELTDGLFEEKVGGAFTRSKFIADKLAIPADLVQARFGGHFGVEEGRIYATDKNGQKVYSVIKPGEVAEFDEALEILVSNYPNKSSILKGAGGSGGGAHNGGGGNGAGGKQQYTRSQFEAMAPADQAKAAREATIVD